MFEDVLKDVFLKKPRALWERRSLAYKCAVEMTWFHFLFSVHFGIKITITKYNLRKPRSRNTIN